MEEGEFQAGALSPSRRRAKWRLNVIGRERPILLRGALVMIDSFLRGLEVPG
jgi:hypothetical protein